MRRLPWWTSMKAGFRSIKLGQERRSKKRSGYSTLGSRAPSVCLFTSLMYRTREINPQGSYERKVWACFSCSRRVRKRSSTANCDSHEMFIFGGQPSKTGERRPHGFARTNDQPAKKLLPSTDFQL